VVIAAVNLGCLSVPGPSALLRAGGCISGFWLEQSHAGQPAVVMNTLDDVSGELELRDDGGRERDPAGMQLGESDRLVAGLAQSLQQPLLLGVSGRHRPDCHPSAGVWAPSSFFQATWQRPEDWRRRVWSR
jgi:hypothetical protein